MKHTSLPAFSHRSFSSFCAFVGVFALAGLSAACGAQTLDGGSNNPPPGTSSSSGSSGSSGSEEQPPAGSSGSNAGTTSDGLPTTPLLGTVKGKAFAPTAFDLQKDPAGSWTLTVHNAAKTSCAKERALGSDITFITIHAVTPAAGLSGKGTSASFQVGFYMSGTQQPDTKGASTLTLRLDSWSDAPGETVKGAMHAANDESDVSGTFTATICAPSAN